MNLNDWRASWAHLWVSALPKAPAAGAAAAVAGPQVLSASAPAESSSAVSATVWHEKSAYIAKMVSKKKLPYGNAN